MCNGNMLSHCFLTFVSSSAGASKLYCIVCSLFPSIDACIIRLMCCTVVHLSEEIFRSDNLIVPQALKRKEEENHSDRMSASTPPESVGDGDRSTSSQGKYVGGVCLYYSV